MYHVSVGWLLQGIPIAFQEASKKIHLRGYDADFMKLSGDFAWKNPLAIDDICSDVCPVRRDLYIANDTKRFSNKQREGKKTWGRIVGLIVEPYCTGLLNEFASLYAGNEKVTYDLLTRVVASYSSKFFEVPTIKKRLQDLNHLTSANPDAASNSLDHLRLVLEYSARNELAFLGVDTVLRTSGDAELSELNKRVPLVVDKAALVFHPDSKLTGLSPLATPDFLLDGMSAVGDVKSGSEFKRSHEVTCAGYALARENELGAEKGDTNFGVIYFIETQGFAPIPARAYFFAIDDELRRAFIDRRDNAYAVLSSYHAGQQIPDVNQVDRGRYCVHCKFLEICDHDRPS